MQFSSTDFSFVSAPRAILQFWCENPVEVELASALRNSFGRQLANTKSGESSVLFRRTKSLVGLDIGSSAVKAIELKPAGKGYKVAAIGVEPIPPDSIVDGAIIV